MRALSILTLCLLLASTLGSAAQVRPAEPTPDSTTETFGDWTVVCATAPPGSGSGSRVCEVGITIAMRGQSGPVARIAFGRLAKDKPMRIVAIVPPNVTIAPGVSITAEPEKSGLALAYRSCLPGGCIAEVELGKDQVQSFRNRAKPGQIAFTDAAGKPVAFELSFKGLDQALDALAKR